MTIETSHHKSMPSEVSSWVDQWVLLKYLTGPSLSGKDADEIVWGNPVVRSGVFYLAKISDMGILIGRQPSTDVEDLGAFIPWSSVLVLVGPQEVEQSNEQNQQQEDPDVEGSS